DTLMVVGHNPGIGDLARILAQKGDPAALEELVRQVPAGGLARFTVAAAGWRETGPATTALQDFVSPKTLECDGS
ncbi:MAG TPA: histidine phosphatase family protein, partial [Alphaproteobacteria bacterium]|nr:histidine phosphatase family protein [Alphaproteobacteria bacterium]